MKEISDYLIFTSDDREIRICVNGSCNLIRKSFLYDTLKIMLFPVGVSRDYIYINVTIIQRSKMSTYSPLHLLGKRELKDC